MATGCATDVKVTAELGFGAIIGKWLPRLFLEVEIKHDEDVSNLLKYLRTIDGAWQPSEDVLLQRVQVRKQESNQARSAR